MCYGLPAYDRAAGLKWGDGLSNPLSNAEAVIAFVAKREGNRAMPASRWAHVMSLELGWLSPGEAQSYVQGCMEAGLLREGEGGLHPSFDIRAVEIPRGLRPEDSPKPAAEGFPAMLVKVCQATGSDKESVLEQVAELQESTGGLLTADVAILRLAARAGLDIRDAALNGSASMR